MYQLFNPYQNTRLVEWSVCKQRLPTCSWLIVKGSYYPINETKLMRQRENSGTTYCNMWETDIGVWKSYNTSQAMGPIQTSILRLCVVLLQAMPPSLPYIIFASMCSKRWDLSKFADVLSMNLEFPRLFTYIHTYVNICTCICMYIHIYIFIHNI